MLDAIRRNAQSWGVKVIFGIIILVFVFWGVGSFRSESGNVLAEINGAPLFLEDYQRIYRQTLDNLRQENPGINVADLERMNLRGQIFTQMVGTRLLEQEAERLHVQVPNDELRRRITQVQAFQDQDQRFNPDQYRAVLRAHNMTPPQFEADFRRDLVMEKVQEFITLPANVSEREARDYFHFAMEQAAIEYIPFPWNQDQEEFIVTDEAVEAHYQAALESFKVPAQIKIAYLNISPATLAKPDAVTQEQIAAYYEANKQEYFKPEQVKARHILIKVPEGASDEQSQAAREQLIALMLRLHKGDAFGDLAREHSEDVSAAQGGDLGWFGRGEMVPEFEEAAFALQPGKTSEPVRTMFGWHLIHVEDRTADSTLALEEVSAAVRRHLAEEQALEALAETLDLALEQVILGSSLEDVGEKLDLPVDVTDFFAMGQSPVGLDLSPESIAQLFALGDGEITQTPILLSDGYLVARKIAHEDETIRPLDEVRDRIVSRLRLDMAQNAAREKAEATLAAIKAEDGQPDQAMQVSAPFGRQGVIPGLGFNPELIAAAFGARPGQWFSDAYQTQEAFIVARLKERIAPDEEQWVEEQDIWRQSLLQSKQRELLQGFMATLQDKAEIKILRQDVLQPNL